MPFKKGQSGNPSGRPKVVGRIRELAREHTETAIQALVDVVTDGKAPPSARVAAATSLLDRGYGKPTTYVETKGNPLDALDTAELELLDAAIESACQESDQGADRAEETGE